MTFDSKESQDIHTKDGRVFFWIIFSFFGFLTIIFSIFATIATSTHRGVVTDNAYKKGVEYNKVVAAADAQEQLGWSGDITYDAPALTYRFYDESKKPIINAKVIAYFNFVGDDGYDFHITMEPDGNAYVAQTFLKQAGQWDIRIAATWQDTPYQQRTRISVK